MSLWKVFYAFFALISLSIAFLKMKPKNTVSLKGRRVGFECRRENSSDPQYPIDWIFTTYGATAKKQFYFDGKFHFNSSALYRVLTNETGQYDLIIDSVDFSYAGTYGCSPRAPDNKPTAQSYSAELVVLDSEPICRGNSLSGLAEYEIMICECQINYRGNAEPQMECTANDDRAIIISSTNYSYSKYNDSDTSISITSAVLASAVTIPKLLNATITCKTSFIIVESYNLDSSSYLFHFWTCASNHAPKDSAEDERKASSDSPPYMIIIVASVLGTLCFIVFLLLLLKKFCGLQKKKENYHSEPAVQMVMEPCEQNEQFVADQRSNQSTPEGIEEGEEHISKAIGNCSSSKASETAYESLAEMHVLSRDKKQREVYSMLHIYANTISTAACEYHS